MWRIEIEKFIILYLWSNFGDKLSSEDFPWSWFGHTINKCYFPQSFKRCNLQPTNKIIKKSFSTAKNMDRDNQSDVYMKAYDLNVNIVV